MSSARCSEKEVIKLSLALKKSSADRDSFISAIVFAKVDIVISPDQILEYGMKRHVYETDFGVRNIFEPRKLLEVEEDPYDIDLSEADAFVPKVSKNEEIIRRLEFREREVEYLAYMNPSRDVAKIANALHLKRYSRKSLASFAEKRDFYRNYANDSEDLRLCIKGEEIIRKIRGDNIFIFKDDVERIEESMFWTNHPIPQEIKDVLENKDSPYSKKEIEIINILHENFLKSGGLKHEKGRRESKKIAREWLEKINAEYNFFNKSYIDEVSKIVTEQDNAEIDFKYVLKSDIANAKLEKGGVADPLVKVLHERKKKSRERSTDIMVLIDICVSKNIEEKKRKISIDKENKKNKNRKDFSDEDLPTNSDQYDYLRFEEFSKILEESGVKSLKLKRCVYSIISHSTNEIIAMSKAKHR